MKKKSAWISKWKCNHWKDFVEADVLKSAGLTVGVLALDVSSGNPAMLLRLEELLYGLWLLGEAVRRDTKDADGSRTDTPTQMHTP